MQEFIYVSQAQLRPCFIDLNIADSFFDRDQFGVRNGGFTVAYSESGQSNCMYNTEMHSPYFDGIVIYQRDAFRRRLREIRDYFLDNFTPHGVVIAEVIFGEKRAVLDFNMSADTNRVLFMKPFFASALASSICEYRLFVHKEHIGDYLLVVRISFRILPANIAAIRIGDDRGEISFDIHGYALKPAELIKQP